MTALIMSIGDYRQFQLTVTDGGLPYDLTGIEAITCTLQTTDGTVEAVWGLGTGVEVSNALGGLAILTVTPAMTSFATSWLTLSYAWGLVDSSGNPYQRIETGTFQLVPPP